MKDQRYHVLFITHDPSFWQALEEQLPFDGKVAFSLSQALSRIQEEIFQLIVFDALEDPGRYLHTLQANGYGGKFFYLLEGGAPAREAFIFKPFALKHFFSELFRVLAEEELVVQIGPCSLDVKLKTLSGAKKSLKLTEKEAHILKMLFKAEGAVVSRETLLSEVWGYQNMGLQTHTLETHIYQLRQKLNKTSQGRVTLFTDPEGYGLACAP